jgi:hypothetical protein
MSNVKTKALLALAATALLTTAAQAVTWTSVAGAPDPGPAPGETMLITFDAPLPSGYALTGSYGLKTGFTSGVAAPPASDTTRYFYVSNTLGTGVATLVTPNLKSISFNWGSVDNYNRVDVLGAGGATLLSLGGGSLPLSNGNQFIPTTNPRVYFTAGANEVITGLRFRATGVAFELDNIAGAAVPEPGSWILMIAGFGLIGAAMRRRAPQQLAHVSA